MDDDTDDGYHFNLRWRNFNYPIVARNGATITISITVPRHRASKIELSALGLALAGEASIEVARNGKKILQFRRPAWLDKPI